MCLGWCWNSQRVPQGWVHQWRVSAHLLGIWKPCCLDRVAFLGTCLPAWLLFSANSSHEELFSSRVPWAKPILSPWAGPSCALSLSHHFLHGVSWALSLLLLWFISACLSHPLVLVGRSHKTTWFRLSGWTEVKKCPQRRYSAISPSHTEAEVTSSFLIPCLSPLPYVEGWRKQALGDFSPGRLSLAVWETWDLQRAFSDLQIWRRTLQTQQRSPSLLLWVPWWEAEATSCIPAMHLPTAPRLLFPQHHRESWNSSSPPQLFLFYFFRGANEGRLL